MGQFFRLIRNNSSLAGCGRGAQWGSPALSLGGRYGLGGDGTSRVERPIRKGDTNGSHQRECESFQWTCAELGDGDVAVALVVSVVGLRPRSARRWRVAGGVRVSDAAFGAVCGIVILQRRTMDVHTCGWAGIALGIQMHVDAGGLNRHQAPTCQSQYRDA
jgi:hypothetical protein